MTVADKMRAETAHTETAEAAEDPTWDTSWTDEDDTPKPEIRPESEDDHVARVVAVTGELVSSMPHDEGMFVIEQMIESETKRLYGRGRTAKFLKVFMRCRLMAADALLPKPNRRQGSLPRLPSRLDKQAGKAVGEVPVTTKWN